MSILKSKKIVTANRLADGEVVWLGRNGVWAENIDGAAVVETQSALDALLDAAARSENDNHVVEPYEIDVTVEGNTVIATRYREQIRATGPSVRLDLGKQAAIAASHAA